MIALTHITKKAYNSLVSDSKKNFADLQEKYGAGFRLRFHGIVTARAVDDFADENGPYDTAESLYEAITGEDYVGAFIQLNELENFMPKGALLDSMIYSMCQARTGDYN